MSGCRLNERERERCPMIGSALKKLAKEYDMTVDKGIAYGSLGGFAATLSEGAGFKQIVFSTCFNDPAGRTGITDTVNARNVKKEFRVQELTVSSKMIAVTFVDNPGTMKRIRAFLDWFLPLLRSFGASGVEICPECGMPIDQGRWAMVNGVAHHFHTGCASRVQLNLEQSNEQMASEDTGNYFSGLVGALLGSALGAVVWAIVLCIGYMASLVGLFIGFLAEKGYNLCKGKQGKGKIAILIVALIFGVLLGTFLAESYDLFTFINSGAAPGWQVSDIPGVIIYFFLMDAEYRVPVLINMVMGLFFAALGAYTLIRQAGRNVSGNRFVHLK